ncbi:MAG: zinc dependent phospholipase C family protein [Lachnospiraceae bacterium]
MPCLYAHNVFGEKVREQFPEEIRQCIQQYEDCYKWGLQGPDFLFFCNIPTGKKIKKMGHRIHRQSLDIYLQKIIPIVKERGVSSAEMAYLLGFLCHFMLDSQCHPYVNAWKEEGYSHADTEKAFDQYLVKLDKKSPEKYPFYTLLPLKIRTIKIVNRMYPWVNFFYIYSSMIFYVMAKRLFYAPRETKRKIITVLTKKMGLYPKLNRHFYWERMQKKFDKKSARLYEMLEEIVEETVLWGKIFWKGIESNTDIFVSDRLRQVDFGGLKIKEEQDEN